MQHPTVKEISERMKGNGKQKKSGKFKKDTTIADALAKMPREEVLGKLYVLYIDDNVGDIIYCGSTKRTLKQRLTEHLRSALNGSSTKDHAIADIIAEGHEVNITLYKKVSLNDMGRAEDEMISTIQGMGVKLLNTQLSVGDTYVAEMTTAWAGTPEDFNSKEGWQKGIGGFCQTSEHAKMIGGVEFYRRGKSRLRFVHAVFGPIQCGGANWHDAVRDAIQLCTVDSPMYNTMKQDYNDTHPGGC